MGDDKLVGRSAFENNETDHEKMGRLIMEGIRDGLFSQHGLDLIAGLADIVSFHQQQQRNQEHAREVEKVQTLTTALQTLLALTGSEFSSQQDFASIINKFATTQNIEIHPKADWAVESENELPENAMKVMVHGVEFAIVTSANFLKIYRREDPYGGKCKDFIRPRWMPIVLDNNV